MFSGKKILLGITGSIAAYKAPFIVRLLVKTGNEVKVIMTNAAKDFVSPLTLSTLSKNKVLVDLFEEDSWANHVALGRWADAMLIAPLSCNTLAKMASGECDNLLLATYLSSKCPIIVAPAMDEDMWQHATTTSNISTIQDHGCRIIPVGHGELASGLIGEGRMAEPEEIVEYLETFFQTQTSLQGYKVLITAGPTYEAIDPVRFIGNHSSGKMGYAIANEFARRGASVNLVSGPVSKQSVETGVAITKVTSAKEMYNACAGQDYDVAVMAAAVADFTPSVKSDVKIKKTKEEVVLTLNKTKDILKSLGENKSDKQVLVGFALETDNEIEHAKKKLREKNADLIILNSLNDAGAGFGLDTNKVTFFFKDGSEKQLELKSKTALAKDIVDSITELL
jgi:phosphopantothenoylcysteine decarboxylase/phosphopantothenate--cysteine ligase